MMFPRAASVAHCVWSVTAADSYLDGRKSECQGGRWILALGNAHDLSVVRVTVC